MDIFLDLMQFVFTPGPAMLTALTVLPLGLAAKLRARHTAKVRNRSSMCGECGRVLLSGLEDEVFLYEGTYVCEGCAERLRSRLAKTVPVLGLLTVGGGAYIVVGLLSGGLLTASQYVLPAIAIAFGSWLSVRASKNANALMQGDPRPLVPRSQDL